MSETYTLADLQAMKSEMDTKKYAAGGVLGPKWSVHVGSHDGFLPVGCISEGAFDKPAANGGLLPEPVRRCHCGRDWHEQPLRKRVAEMLRGHYFDPDYKAAEDVSPIVCVGSETYGPNRPDYVRDWAQSNYGGIGIKPGSPWLQVINEAYSYTTSQLWNILGGGSWKIPEPEWPALNINTWFTPVEPKPCEHTDLELEVKLGHWPVEPSNAKFSERHKASKAAATVPVNEWREPLPLPECLGLDVSALADEFNKKHNPQYPKKGLNA